MRYGIANFIQVMTLTSFFLQPSAPSTTRRKSIVAPSTERRKSIAPDAPSQPRRKSIIPSSINTANVADRRKSTMTPSASPSPTQRRKSVVADASPQTKKRPTSLLQNTTTANRTGTIPSSKSTAVPNRRSIVPPKQSANGTAPIKRARSNTQTSSPVSILKTRTPITAPTTPDTMLDDEQDEEIRRLELEQAEFDNLCHENTTANSAIVSSPVSLEKEQVDDDEEEEEEEDEEMEEQRIIQQIQQQEPVYGSLASSRPISKSDQV